MQQQPPPPTDAIMLSSKLPPMDTEPMRMSEISSGPLSVARTLINTFATVKYQRDPPNVSKTKHIRLITVTVSHFCEKIRWGLDLVEEDSTSPYYYTEDGHPPAFVSFFTVPASKNESSATPMLVDDNGKVEWNSERLFMKFCPFLYPDPVREEIQQLEHDMGHRIGATLRCFVYHYLMQPSYKTGCVKMCAAKSSKVEAVLFDAMFTRGISDGMREVMKIDEDSAIASRDELLRVFDELSRRLEENGGEYLMDTKETSYGFSAADLTLAALAYPLVRPPEMSNFLLAKDEDYPPEVLQLSQQLRATRAGQHVLRMYQKHRPTNAVATTALTVDGENPKQQPVVVMKSAEIRDRWCFA